MFSGAIGRYYVCLVLQVSLYLPLQALIKRLNFNMCNIRTPYMRSLILCTKVLRTILSISRGVSIYILAVN
jgi:hypothetical protein